MMKSLVCHGVAKSEKIVKMAVSSPETRDWNSKPRCVVIQGFALPSLLGQIMISHDGTLALKAQFVHNWQCQGETAGCRSFHIIRRWKVPRVLPKPTHSFGLRCHLKAFQVQRF
jgi:hypothetical protein